MHPPFNAARGGMHHHPGRPFEGRAPGGGFGGWGPWPGHGPRGFGGPGPRARRGDVRSALLGLLADGPSNGYGLIKAIGERTGGVWQPSPGSVYPTLAQLVDEGLVEQSGGPRAEYSLTEAGRAYVEEHRDQIDAALDARGEGPGTEDLLPAIGKLMGVVYQFRMADAAQRARAVEKIDALRRELYAILAE
jgi:DNA-binding PadR family transcriptional regulator